MFAFPTSARSLFAFLPALLRTGLAASVLPTTAECQQRIAPILPLSPTPPPTAFRQSGVVNSQEILALAAKQSNAMSFAKITKYIINHPAPIINNPLC
ncbi:hypothetical protein CDA63_07790 [Hymenobacter amundsenii]|uniref:Secreted protein n=1 Tax=Hymenobacter amundsenii TaxID=2006685 RepID=A0A246FLT3_9BACT|nr:hypothetical protein [Hymenobacter amundsenii]OWP63682.1 hypothetical protein CDA63_07790 [Hymenobacter amundsenii]